MKKQHHVHRSVENNSVVAEEKMGFGSTILPSYNNTLSPDIADRIQRMSAVEVIS